ncbi:chitobiase/beta-hexosaminidase C-terminal domain-containing protein [Brevibacillus formosus]|uniref:chitobiase/beta-hexosaminidase C-terminal domain-containing protein n=1 Tax=Brevibacillus formosus TaxID=54913 RepID=UPI003F19920F
MRVFVLSLLLVLCLTDVVFARVWKFEFYQRYTDSADYKVNIDGYTYRVIQKGTDGIEYETQRLSYSPGKGDSLVRIYDVIDRKTCLLTTEVRIISEEKGLYHHSSVVKHTSNPNACVPDTTPPTVTISPNSGEFTDSLSVSISSNEPGQIYYSLNGSEPSTRYTSPLTITETTTVKAKAIDEAGLSSGVVSATYTKRAIQPTLSFDPSSTSFSKSFDLNIIANPVGSEVYYSVDGSEPTIKFTSSIRISKKTTVKAKAVYKGVSSPVYQIVYSPSPIQTTDDKYFMVPPVSGQAAKHALDFINVGSPSMWLFASAFLGLLILGYVKGVFKK